MLKNSPSQTLISQSLKSFIMSSTNAILVEPRASKATLMMFKHARINQQNNHKTLYCHVGTIIIATILFSLQLKSFLKLLVVLSGARMPDDPLMHLHNYDTISPDSSWANGGRIINFYSKAITLRRREGAFFFVQKISRFSWQATKGFITITTI